MSKVVEYFKKYQVVQPFYFGDKSQSIILSDIIFNKMKSKEKDLLNMVCYVLMQTLPKDIRNKIDKNDLINSVIEYETLKQ